MAFLSNPAHCKEFPLPGDKDTQQDTLFPVSPVRLQQQQLHNFSSGNGVILESRISQQVESLVELQQHPSQGGLCEPGVLDAAVHRHQRIQNDCARLNCPSRVVHKKESFDILNIQGGDGDWLYTKKDFNEEIGGSPNKDELDSWYPFHVPGLQSYPLQAAHDPTLRTTALTSHTLTLTGTTLNHLNTSSSACSPSSEQPLSSQSLQSNGRLFHRSCSQPGSVCELQPPNESAADILQPSLSDPQAPSLIPAKRRIRRHSSPANMCIDSRLLQLDAAAAAAAKNDGTSTAAAGCNTPSCTTPSSEADCFMLLPLPPIENDRVRRAAAWESLSRTLADGSALSRAVVLQKQRSFEYNAQSIRAVLGWLGAGSEDEALGLGATFHFGHIPPSDGSILSMPLSTHRGPVADALMPNMVRDGCAAQQSIPRPAESSLAPWALDVLFDSSDSEADDAGGSRASPQRLTPTNSMKSGWLRTSLLQTPSSLHESVAPNDPNKLGPAGPIPAPQSPANWAHAAALLSAPSLEGAAGSIGAILDLKQDCERLSWLDMANPVVEWLAPSPRSPSKQTSMSAMHMNILSSPSRSNTGPPSPASTIIRPVVGGSPLRALPSSHHQPLNPSTPLTTTSLHNHFSHVLQALQHLSSRPSTPASARSRLPLSPAHSLLSPRSSVVYNISSLPDTPLSSARSWRRSRHPSFRDRAGNMGNTVMSFPLNTLHDLLQELHQNSHNMHGSMMFTPMHTPAVTPVPTPRNGIRPALNASPLGPMARYTHAQQLPVLPESSGDGLHGDSITASTSISESSHSSVTLHEPRILAIPADGDHVTPPRTPAALASEHALQNDHHQSAWPAASHSEAVACGDVSPHPASSLTVDVGSNHVLNADSKLNPCTFSLTASPLSATITAPRSRDASPISLSPFVLTPECSMEDWHKPNMERDSPYTSPFPTDAENALLEAPTIPVLRTSSITSTKVTLDNQTIPTLKLPVDNQMQVVDTPMAQAGYPGGRDVWTDVKSGKALESAEHDGTLFSVDATLAAFGLGPKTDNLRAAGLHTAPAAAGSSHEGRVQQLLSLHQKVLEARTLAEKQEYSRAIDHLLQQGLASAPWAAPLISPDSTPSTTSRSTASAPVANSPNTALTAGAGSNNTTHHSSTGILFASHHTDADSTSIQVAHQNAHDSSTSTEATFKNATTEIAACGIADNHTVDRAELVAVMDRFVRKCQPLDSPLPSMQPWPAHSARAPRNTCVEGEVRMPLVPQATQDILESSRQEAARSEIARQLDIVHRTLKQPENAQETMAMQGMEAAHEGWQQDASFLPLKSPKDGPVVKPEVPKLNLGHMGIQPSSTADRQCAVFSSRSTDSALLSSFRSISTVHLTTYNMCETPPPLALSIQSRAITTSPMCTDPKGPRATGTDFMPPTPENAVTSLTTGTNIQLESQGAACSVSETTVQDSPCQHIQAGSEIKHKATSQSGLEQHLQQAERAKIHQAPFSSRAISKTPSPCVSGKTSLSPSLSAKIVRDQHLEDHLDPHMSTADSSVASTPTSIPSMQSSSLRVQSVTSSLIDTAPPSDQPDHPVPLSSAAQLTVRSNASAAPSCNPMPSPASSHRSETTVDVTPTAPNSNAALSFIPTSPAASKTNDGFKNSQLGPANTTHTTLTSASHAAFSTDSQALITTASQLTFTTDSQATVTPASQASVRSKSNVTDMPDQMTSSAVADDTPRTDGPFSPIASSSPTLHLQQTPVAADQHGSQAKPLECLPAPDCSDSQRVLKMLMCKSNELEDLLNEVRRLREEPQSLGASARSVYTNPPLPPSICSVHNYSKSPRLSSVRASAPASFNSLLSLDTVHTSMDGLQHSQQAALSEATPTCTDGYQHSQQLVQSISAPGLGSSACSSISHEASYIQDPPAPTRLPVATATTFATPTTTVQPAGGQPLDILKPVRTDSPSSMAQKRPHSAKDTLVRMSADPTQNLLNRSASKLHGGWSVLDSGAMPPLADLLKDGDRRSFLSGSLDSSLRSVAQWLASESNCIGSPSDTGSASQSSAVHAVVRESVGQGNGEGSAKQCEVLDETTRGQVSEALECASDAAGSSAVRSVSDGATSSEGLTRLQAMSEKVAELRARRLALSQNAPITRKRSTSGTAPALRDAIQQACTATPGPTTPTVSSTTTTPMCRDSWPASQDPSHSACAPQPSLGRSSSSSSTSKLHLSEFLSPSPEIATRSRPSKPQKSSSGRILLKDFLM